MPDPDLGRAYSALAYSLAFNFRRGWNDAPMHTIARAVELDSSLPRTYWSPGYAHLMRREIELTHDAQALQTLLDELREAGLTE